MAKILTDHDFGQQMHGNAKYPWSEWTDGKTRSIERGVDFDVEPRIMQGQVKVRSTKEGRRVATSVAGDVVTFTFQRVDESLDAFSERINKPLAPLGR